MPLMLRPISTVIAAGLVAGAACTACPGRAAVDHVGSCEDAPRVADPSGQSIAPLVCQPAGFDDVSAHDGLFVWSNYRTVAEYELDTRRRRGMPSWSEGPFQTNSTLLDGEWLYFAACGAGGCGSHGSNSTVSRRSLKTGERHLLSASLLSVSAIELHGPDVCWTTMGAYGNGGEVECMGRRGGGVRRIFDGDFPQSAVEAISADDEAFFLATEEARIYLVPRRGDGRPIVLSGPHSSVNGITADESFVYWTDGGDVGGIGGYVWRAPRDGGTPEVLVGPITLPGELITDHVALYWTNAAGELWQMHKATGQVGLVALAQGADLYRGRDRLHVHGGALYWALSNNDGGAIFRLVLERDQGRGD